MMNGIGGFDFISEIRPVLFMLVSLMDEVKTKDVLWNSNYVKVIVANFSLFFAFYLLTPLLPLYLVDRWEAEKDVVGLVLSGYTLVALLSRPFSGFLADTFDRKKVLMVCYFMFFAIFGGYLAAGSLLLFALVRTLHGGPFGALTVANSTVAIDVLPPSRRSEGIGYYGLGNNLAMAIAPTIGILLYNYLGNFDLLFALAFVIAGIGMAIDSRVKLKPREKVEGKRPISLDRFFLLRGWFLSLDMVCYGFCFGVLSNYLAIYGRESLGIVGGTGAYFAVLSAGLILSRLQGAKALREGRLVSNAAAGIVLSTIGYTIFIAVPGMWSYYASALLIGLGNGHMWPAFQNMMISIATKYERGTANSTILVSWDIGVGIGILLGGVLSHAFGYGLLFWTVSTVHILGLALFLGWGRRFFEKRRLA